MKNFVCKLVLIACVLFGFVNPVVFGDDSERVQIETIHDLSLSGYNEDEHGTLQWRLNANTANIDPKTKSKDIKRAVWNLQQLKLSTFGKDGVAFAEMTSPDGRFNPEKREADSKSKVEVRGGSFTVRGNGWSWTGESHENTIRVLANVFVAIALPDKNENLTVISKHLLIQGSETQTVLTFSGAVNVFYGDIFMVCDALEVLVPSKGKKISVLGESKSSAELDAIQKITGSGHLKITRGTVSLSGDVVEFLPPQNLFFVRGNALLEDGAGRVLVRGDEANGKIAQRFVEVIATKPNNALPLSPIAVSVEMPSIITREESSSVAAGSTGAIVMGKRMTVSSPESEKIGAPASSKAGNVISLFDEVRVIDQDLHIDADKLVVTMNPSAASPLSDSLAPERKDALGKVRSAVAEGNVRADHLGRILYCGRADVLPNEKRITLTGSPRVVSREENASLEGDRVEIYLDQDLIEVFSSDEKALDRRRVTVDLPRFTGGAGNTPATSSARSLTEDLSGTKVVGDHLTLTRGKDTSTFDIFGNVELSAENLDGNCHRLVVFADPNTKEKNKSQKNGALSQIKKIIADGDVELTQGGYVLSGGRATITPSVELKEWIPEDRAFDEKMPFWIVVEPDVATKKRPRITFPRDSAGTSLGFALPLNPNLEKKKGAGKGLDEELPLTKTSAPENTRASKETYLESDSMELIGGESRTRFFLRGDVVLATDGGAHGMCNSVEGLMTSRAPSPADKGVSPRGFDVKKMICRGNVRLVHDGSTGQGSILEVFPLENRAVLSGNASFREKKGTILRPGNDRFVFDLETRQLITGTSAGKKGENPEQVSRPQIIIPKESNRVFVIPNSIRGNVKK